jgi:hypothetical protein
MKHKNFRKSTGKGVILTEDNVRITQGNYLIENDQDVTSWGFARYTKSVQLNEKISGRLVTDVKLKDTIGVLRLQIEDGRFLRLERIDEAVEDDETGVYTFEGTFIEA